MPLAFQSSEKQNFFKNYVKIQCASLRSRPFRIWNFILEFFLISCIKLKHLMKYIAFGILVTKQ